MALLKFKRERPANRPLGRRELIDLPALSLHGVEAKVDTGAYTSAIHCTEVHLVADPATGQPVLHVRLLDPGHPPTDGRSKFRTNKKAHVSGGFFMFCRWWAVQGSNLRPLPCEGNALPLS